MSELGTLSGMSDGMPVAGPAASDAVAASAPAPGLAQPPPVAGDVVSRVPMAFPVAFAQFAAALRESQGVRDETGAPGSDLLESLKQRYGDAVATLVAALPTAMRGAFMTRLAALAPGSEREAAPQEQAGTAPTKADLAAAIVAGGNDAATILAATRLASLVARYGIDAGLQLMTPPAAAPGSQQLPIFAVNALTPTVMSVDSRGRRRQEDQRRRRDPERAKNVETPEETPGVAIDDTVQFGGTTVASGRTLPPRRFAG
jgi:hypothetical protein